MVTGNHHKVKLLERFTLPRKLNSIKFNGNYKYSKVVTTSAY